MYLLTGLYVFTNCIVNVNAERNRRIIYMCMYASISFAHGTVDSCSSGDEFSSSVPSDDLSVLKGCVTRTRALFSPTPSVDTAYIQLGGMRSTGTWPDLISSHDTRDSVFHARLPSSDNSSAATPRQAYPVSQQYSVSIQFGGVGRDEKSPLGTLAHSSVKRKFGNELQKTVKERSSAVQGNGSQLHPVSRSIPGRLNSPSLRLLRKVDHLSHSPSCCSCASYVSERMLTNRQQLLDIPAVRTSSLDGQGGAACGSDSPRVFHHSRHHCVHHGRGKCCPQLFFSIVCVHILLYLYTCTCIYIHK